MGNGQWATGKDNWQWAMGKTKDPGSTSRKKDIRRKCQDPTILIGGKIRKTTNQETQGSKDERAQD
jgi:hypothetical protein